jgi:lipopolysaccharide export system permease protein
MPSPVAKSPVKSTKDNFFNTLPWGWSVMDRYIIMQLIPPLIFGVAAFTSVVSSVATVFDLIRKMTEVGLPLSIAVQVYFLQLPEFVSLALPMSMLLATLLLYSRLSADSELIALRSVGVSVYRLVLPAVLVSLVVTGLTFVLNESIVPAAKYQAGLTLDRALKQDKPNFKEKNILHQEYRDVKLPNGTTENALARIFYARQFDGTQMKGLTILDFSQAGLNQIIASESAAWDPTKQVWDFFNGTIYLVAPDGSYRNIVKFEKQELQLPRTPLDLATHKRDFLEMNIAELRDYEGILINSGDAKETNKLRLRIQQKLSFPFVCLVFGLVGATLGTRPQRRSGKGASFALSVVIIFTYYLLSFVCNSFGQLSILPYGVAAWLPTILGLLAGGGLLFRAAR